MKKIKLLLLVVLVTSISCAQKKSPKNEAKGTLDGVNITINYSSPSVKGRTIWGGLEKYGKVWRAGADENTTVTFDKDVTIGGKEVKAGKYGFFIIPNENGDWVAIFNAKNDAWGAFSYKESEDVARINVTPSFVNEIQESLTYSVSDKTIDFAWEKVRLSIPVSKK